MITLTEAARDIISKTIGDTKQNVYFGVRGGGCSGFQYVFALIDREADDKEVSFDIGSFKVIVDKRCMPLVDGTSIDYEVVGLESGFVFDNPNATGGCGCGKSVSVKGSSCDSGGCGDCG